MPDWPRPYHPVVDGVPNTTRTVEVYPHEPGRTDLLAAWVEAADVLTVGGQPCIVLPGTRRVRDRLVGLGDVAVRDADTLRAVPGGELAGSVFPADVEEVPPAGEPE